MEHFDDNVLEHCDERTMEPCDDNYHGAFSLKEAWGTVITGVVEHCDDKC